MPPQHRYEQVLQDLLNQIGPGKTYPPGSKLPSRKLLREQYEVSDIVIDTVMRILRREGVIETLHGVGVYVRQPEDRQG